MDKIIIVVICIIIVLFCILICNSNNKDEDFGDTYYDYDIENPNALVSGTNVAGTVYNSYPGLSGGQGWIL